MNELIPISPISPLRQRLIDDMAMRRFGEETQRNYIRDVGRFATWLGRSPHTASVEDLRRFQIEQQEAGVPVPTMNTIVSALRFFFTHTLDRPELAAAALRLTASRGPEATRRTFLASLTSDDKLIVAAMSLPESTDLLFEAVRCGVEGTVHDYRIMGGP